jgi:lipopolysaccharide transport system ATP-binding protein
VEFVSVEIDGHPSTAIPADEDLVLRIDVRGRQATPRFRFSMTIFRGDSTPVGSMFAREVDGVQKDELAQYRLVLHDLRLAPGSYFFGLATGVGDHLTGHRDFDVLLDVLSFTVMAPTGDRGTVSHWTEGWGTIRFVPPTVTRLDGSCQVIGQSGAA